MIAGHTPGPSSEDVWARVATLNEWIYSPAHGGYIRFDHLDPDGSNPSELSAEDACFLDGIETLEAACAVLSECAK